MTLNEMFEKTNTYMPPIESFIFVKTEDQYGPTFGKIDAELELKPNKTWISVLDKYRVQVLGKKPLFEYGEENLVDNDLFYRYFAIVRFGYLVTVSILWTVEDIYEYQYEYGEIKLDEDQQEHVHKICDEYTRREFDMGINEMWKKEW